MPELSVIAGANGSGKSTLTKSKPEIIPIGIPTIDPDAIAHELDPLQPAKVAVLAGRTAIALAQDYFQKSVSFAIETTLAGNNYLKLMNSVKQQGWQVNLIYVGIDNSETNIRRVRERVRRGGHHVPTEDIRRRYVRSLNNLAKAIAIADNVALYDNSDRQFSLVATISFGVISIYINRYPSWCTSIENLLTQPENPR
jgi:predicted ABC-type ATPase